MYAFSLGENFAKLISRPFTLIFFHDTTPISLIKFCEFYFSLGEIFAKRIMS